VGGRSDAGLRQAAHGRHALCAPRGLRQCGQFATGPWSSAAAGVRHAHRAGRRTLEAAEAVAAVNGKTEADSKKGKKELSSKETRSLDPAEKPEEAKKKTQRAPKGSGPLSLKSLTLQRWGREIQKSGQRGHDSLEDAIAARDLAHWHVLAIRGVVKAAPLEVIQASD